jgi:hypothetical protein
MTESEQKYFEVMLEQILHEVKTVAEGHGVLDEKIERFHKEAKANHRLAMDLIKFSHDELKSEIQGVDRKLTSEIRAVGDKVNAVNGREGALGHKVNTPFCR